ncbi:MAG: hypothetical protein JXB49_27475 [Bacteroidales bacterium]|nr:hypothetical protein [Bacteroidales bacterium]
MKRIGLIIWSLLISLAVTAQNEVDALKYSWDNNLTGTARSASMGGAFSALGGDVSSISLNPAGLGVYRSSEFVFTPAIYQNYTEADYLKSTNSGEKFNFNFNNMAYVGCINGLSGGWESVSIGVGYNRKNNYHQNTVISGNMETGNLTTGGALSSYLDNFTYYAELDDPYGLQYHEIYYPDGDYILDPHYEELAYNTDLILYQVDTTLENGGFWWNEMHDDGYNQNQRRVIKTDGSSGEYYFAVGGNYSNTLYIGASVGYHHFREEYLSVHTETDIYDSIDYIYDFRVEESYRTYGNGVDFKVGMIYKPVEFIRISGAFHTPTFYKIQVEYSNIMGVTIDPEYGGGTLSSYSYEPGLYDYRLRTPMKAIAGLAFQFDKYALLSFDYEYVDYSKMNLSSDVEDQFSETNSIMRKKYDATHNVRGGLELRNGPLSIRGGAAYYDSPFSSKEVNKDAYSIFYTGGIGLRSEDFFIDFAYLYGIHKEKYFMYYLPEEFGELEEVNLRSTFNKFMLTLGFRF